MDDPGKKCDICGERQLSANGWIRYRDPFAGEFRIKPKHKPRIQTASTHKDACGHECIIKALVTWLGANHVNAPMELKKDATP